MQTTAMNQNVPKVATMSSNRHPRDVRKHKGEEGKQVGCINAHHLASGSATASDNAQIQSQPTNAHTCTNLRFLHLQRVDEAGGVGKLKVPGKLSLGVGPPVAQALFGAGAKGERGGGQTGQREGEGVK